MKILSMPSGDRPREKLLSFGASQLTDSELLALLLGSGTKGANVLEVAQDLLTRFGGLHGLTQIDVPLLRSVKGIGQGKATLISALGELFHRIECQGETQELSYVLKEMQDRVADVEEAYVLSLDGRGQVVGKRLVSRGDDSALSLTRKQVLRVALSLGARSFVLIHTHPSGNPLPSPADLRLTGELFAIANKIGVTMMDHIILARSGLYSFQANGLL